MFQLDVMLKFWELIFALVAAALMVAGLVYVAVKERRRRNPPGFYVEAGGVALTLGEERLLEAIARAREQHSLAELAQLLGADEIAVYLAARMLTQKDLITEAPSPDGGSPRYELSATGNAAALARNYIKLI
jgi:DNA-binding MarR family transcriptional regulator